MNIGFIGAGKVGCSLGRYFILHGFFVSGYYSRSTASAETAAGLTDSQTFDNEEKLIAASDVVFITVPDNAIVGVWENIRKYDFNGKTVCHCSGAMASEVFTDSTRGGFRASMHPLMAVSSTGHDMSDAFFTIEGDDGGVLQIRKILDKCGNTYQEICKTNKVKYHAAAAVASNLVVGLLDMAVSMLMECGFDEVKAREALTPLVIGNAQAVMNKGAQDALTGPVSRGDDTTVKKHMDILQDGESEIYRLLSLRLLELADLSKEDDYNKMKGILEK